MGTIVIFQSRYASYIYSYKDIVYMFFDVKYITHILDMVLIKIKIILQ